MINREALLGAGYAEYVGDAGEYTYSKTILGNPGPVLSDPVIMPRRYVIVVELKAGMTGHFQKIQFCFPSAQFRGDVNFTVQFGCMPDSSVADMERFFAQVYTRMGCSPLAP